MADSSTDGVRVSSHRCRRRHQKTKEADLISSLPDEILLHILSFTPTKFAIRTSLLSKRWKHVWCETPSLSFDNCTQKLTFINKTLKRYTAPKMIKFHLKTDIKKNVRYINKWIELAMSRNAENMSLDFYFCSSEYKIADSFYIYSSVKQLSLQLNYSDMIPRWLVSWTSLKKLLLHCCCLPDESFANIVSGCPILESLILYYCKQIRVLDLSKALQLRTLEIKPHISNLGQMHIVAPQIHRLSLRNSQMPFTLVDVSSLKEAKVDICFVSIHWTYKHSFLHVMHTLPKMLEKLQNVENFTLGRNFLHILSLAEICGVPFPMLKVRTLTLETVIFQYVIPGIERLLQNSPELKKLIVRPARDRNTIPEKYLDQYLKSQGFNPDQCWRSKDKVFWNRYLPLECRVNTRDLFGKTYA